AALCSAAGAQAVRASARASRAGRRCFIVGAPFVWRINRCFLVLSVPYPCIRVVPHSRNFVKFWRSAGPVSYTKFYQNHTAAWFRRPDGVFIIRLAARAQRVFPRPVAHAYKTDATTRSGNQMKHLTKRAAALLGAAALSLNLAACGATANAVESAAESTEASSTAASSPAVENATAEQASAGVPKYIFLFIGDGMSYPQIQSTNYYLS